jgi:2-dehydro-3-deoxygluconokinase
MKKVFCFGELLLRMSPDDQRQWIHRASMPVYIGGAELNVAHALAKWNVPVKYCTAIPGNFLGREIISELKEKKIDTSSVFFSEGRIGLYYLPQGNDLKNTSVIYDRSDAAFAQLKPGMINWQQVLEGCDWFHFSAISPGLNSTMPLVLEEALTAAREMGLKISVDLNYRSRLWQYGKRPPEIMHTLVDYCNVVMGNVWAAEQLLDISSGIDSSEGKSKEEMIDAAGRSMRQLHMAYRSIMAMAFTYRLDKEYFAILQNGTEMAISKKYKLENIVDRVGSGDCFMAGLIYGFLRERSSQEIVDYAAAAAVGKMAIMGDATTQEESEINRIKESAS